MSPIASVNQNPTPLINVSHCLGKKRFLRRIILTYIVSKLIQPDPNTDKTDQHKFAILDGQLVLTRKTNRKKITSLEAWADAFIVFASIYFNETSSRHLRHSKIYPNH